jgi:hypothetical protein
MFHLISCKALGVDVGIDVDEASRLGKGLTVGVWIPGVSSVGSRFAAQEAVKRLNTKAIKLHVFIVYLLALAVSFNVC